MMPKDGGYKLIEDDGKDRNKEKRVVSKRKVLIFCCGCCVIFIAIFLIARIITALIKSGSNRTSEEITFPKNLSEFLMQNKKLCEKLRGKNAAKEATTNSVANIYLVKEKHNLTKEQACSIESVLRLFPDKTIYLIDFDKVPRVDLEDSGARPTYLQLLLYLYKDRLQLVSANDRAFFKDTLFHNVTREEGIFHFLAILVTAYKYGGFAATPSVVMTSREILECVPKDTVIEPFAILTSRTCDESLYYMMESFVLCRRYLAEPLDEVLSKSAELYSSSRGTEGRGLRRLRPHEICSSTRSPSQFIKTTESNTNGSRWASDFSPYCMQVVQAYLGLRLNKMQVEEETYKIKTTILENGNKTCSDSKQWFEGY